MQVLEILQKFLDICSKILEFGREVQNKARDELVADLQKICGNCERAYSNLFAKLRPIKDSYNDTAALSTALRTFASGSRADFHPDNLCGDINALLFKLENNLDALKYSVDLRKIGDLKSELTLIGSYDNWIYASYDAFAKQLDNLATELQAARPDEASDRKAHVRHVIDEFERDLFATLRSVQEAKDRILH